MTAVKQTFCKGNNIRRHYSDLTKLVNKGTTSREHVEKLATIQTFT